MKRAIAFLALVASTLCACDECEAHTKLARFACDMGDAEACTWLDEHATAGGTCH